MKQTGIGLTSVGAVAVVLTVVLSVGLAGGAWAIQPQTWTHDAEADFEPGDPDGVVITDKGRLRLAGEEVSIGGLPESVSVVYGLARVGETVYVAGGPVGYVGKVEDGEVVEVKAYGEAEQVFVIEAYKGGLLAGVSSADGARVEWYDGSSWSVVAELPGERYVWDFLETDKGLVVATGIEGRVYLVAEGVEPAVIYDGEQANVLCLAGGAEAAGGVFVGTDTDGWVVRLTPGGGGAEGEAWDPYVLLDADEAEVGALLLGPDGTLYAGTSDADGARPGRLEDPVEEEAGEPMEVEEEAEPEAEAAEEAEAEAEGEPAAEAVEEPEAEAEEPGLMEVKPTAEDRDRLREMLRERLLAARESGRLEGPDVDEGRADEGGDEPRRSRARTVSDREKKSGNAVYAISPEGFVTEAFRESVMMLALSFDGQGRLLVSTGDEGQVYRVELGGNRAVAELLKLEGKQVLAVLPDDGEGSVGVLAGGSNPAGLLYLAGGPEAEGVYTSPVMDAGQVSLWGKMRLRAGLPAGSAVVVQSRSSNVADPDHAGWSGWGEAVTLDGGVEGLVEGMELKEVAVDAPPARFLQYRLSFEAGDIAVGEGPTVDRVDLSYVVPNLPPAVTSLTVDVPDAPEPGGDPKPVYEIEWEAEDPNGDGLTYRVEYLPVGSEKFLKLAEGVTDDSVDWDTRRVPDGRYVVRVVASDAVDNPPDMARSVARVSEVVSVDNGRPELAEVEHAVEGRTLTVSGVASDAFSPLGSLGYSLDGEEEFSVLVPEDLILDSTSEAWSVTLRGLARGPHVLTLRVVDARGNALYRNVFFEVP
ncbi:MAG: hypothetical protein AAF750_05665 [Planctomycetota bacterium]